MTRVAQKTKKYKAPEALPLLFNIGQYASTSTLPDAVDLEGFEDWGINAREHKTQTPTNTEADQSIDTSNCSRAFSVLRQDSVQVIDKRVKRPTSGWIEIYSPSTRKGQQYYRYCYSVKGERRTRQAHIRGGNINAAESQHRKAEIEEAIALGRSPEEIIQLC